jgi:hypothetical protein
MTPYSFALFIHVVSAIGLFVALALEGIVFIRIRSARTDPELQFFIQGFERLRVIYIPSFLGILVGGLYLASLYGGGAFWIPSALAATLAMALVGGLVTGRNLSRLKKLAGDEAVSFESVSARTKSNSLLASYGLRAGLALGIVFLMTSKPQLLASIAALGAGCVLGLGVALGLRRIADRTRVRCEPWGRVAQPTAQRS